MKNKFCCNQFKHFINIFYWMSYYDNEDNIKYIMPYIYKDGVKYRVNHCFSCGTEIRDIELSKI